MHEWVRQRLCVCARARVCVGIHQCRYFLKCEPFQIQLCQRMSMCVLCLFSQLNPNLSVSGSAVQHWGFHCACDLCRKIPKRKSARVQTQSSAAQNITETSAASVATNTVNTKT